ncbi:MAG: hypothetical protein SNJ82_06730, partial [Gemmataceae bacterium]
WRPWLPSGSLAHWELDAVQLILVILAVMLASVYLLRGLLRSLSGGGCGGGCGPKTTPKQPPLIALEELTARFRAKSS